MREFPTDRRTAGSGQILSSRRGETPMGLRSHLKDITAVEYAVILALIIVVVIIAITALGSPQQAPQRPATVGSQK